MGVVKAPAPQRRLEPEASKHRSRVTMAPAVAPPLPTVEIIRGDKRANEVIR